MLGNVHDTPRSQATLISESIWSSLLTLSCSFALCLGSLAQSIPNNLDIGKVKGPLLRGLAARAPYFHNGAAANLGVVVDFYNQRFNLNLSSQQKADLVAFLQTL